jgi:prolyl-tRNA synthetase
MGSYGIGPGRIMSAAVEQNHDEWGIAWPKAIAPYDVEVVALEAAGPDAMAIAEVLADDLEKAGLDVLVDDRDRRPGEKFADADLIGLPYRITVGKKVLEDGKVDLVTRAGRVEERVTVSDVVTRVTDS